MQATVKAHRVRVDGFSKIRAMLLPSRDRPRTPARLVGLEGRRKLEQIAELGRGEIEQLEEVTTTEIACHESLQAGLCEFPHSFRILPSRNRLCQAIRRIRFVFRF